MYKILTVLAGGFGAGSSGGSRLLGAAFMPLPGARHQPSRPCEVRFWALGSQPFPSRRHVPGRPGGSCRRPVGRGVDPVIASLGPAATGCRFPCFARNEGALGPGSPAARTALAPLRPAPIERVDPAQDIRARCFEPLL